MRYLILVLFLFISSHGFALESSERSTISDVDIEIEEHQIEEALDRIFHHSDDSLKLEIENMFSQAGNDIGQEKVTSIYQDWLRCVNYYSNYKVPREWGSNKMRADRRAYIDWLITKCTRGDSGIRLLPR